MQFTTASSYAIRSRGLTVTFRNWRRPHARVGGVYRLRPRGQVRVTDIRTVALGSVSGADLARAGFDSVEALAKFLDLPRNALVTRVAFEPAQASALARAPVLGVDEALARLAATDRRSRAPWTREVIELIQDQPGVRAGDLAAVVGWETAKFKTHVRRLKALGLTESLEIGYRVTDLGERVAEALKAAAAPP